MSVLDREALQASPLADLHALASELSIDGYRRLRKADLIDAIVERQGGASGDSGADDDDSGSAAGSRRRGRGRGRGRGARDGAAVEPAASADEAGAGDEAGADTESDGEPAPARSRARSRSRRSGAGSGSGPEAADRTRAEEPGEEEPTVEGVVELLPNGSGFVRVSPPEPSDDDVYISAAQVKRCELVSGDTVTGPRRAPRRSERFASLVRVDTINGRPAADAATGTRFDELPAAFPTEQIKLGSGDPTLEAIDSLAPFGKGSRVTIAGGALGGKTETLRRIAAALATDESLEVSLVLAGVRPEEIAEWSADDAAPSPVQALSFAASADAQDHAVELVVDQAQRLAARGADAVVLVDTLAGLHLPAARKALAAARNIVGGGSLTVIATAPAPLGGETTVIALDAAAIAAGQLPAVDPARSATLKADALVGEDGVKAIAQARAAALGG